MNPTKRFVLDISRKCNIKCKFCYYLHTYDQWGKYNLSFNQCKEIIDKGIERGNDYFDVTGGEPSIHPEICDVVKYGKDKGLGVCIITNGIVSEKRTQDILDAGIDDWLVSRHGLRHTHDFITNCNNAYHAQVRFLNQISANMRFRFNCVINKFNQNEIFDIAHEMAEYNPYIVNFINMNPHHEWMEKELSTKEVAADLNIVDQNLNKAISFLESKEICVNVRYYPMCRIAEDYRRCICNDKQVVFDQYEWDYDIYPKTYEKFKAWGESTSNNVEWKEEPCKNCNLFIPCGGINKAFNKATEGKFLNPVKEGKYISDFYHYRADNLNKWR